MKRISTALALLVATTVAPAFAADEYNLSTGTTVEGQRVAVRGSDTVALALGLGVTEGEARFTHVHDGGAYYFASDAAMNAFAADPEAYLPQYGGFCALGVALGKKLDANPRYADVVDGKLYLFLNAAVFEKYLEDKESVLEGAAKNWPEIHHIAVADANS